MNEGRYGQVISDASEGVLRAIGTPPDATDRTGLTWFTVNSQIDYRQEAMAGERFVVDSRITGGSGKKLHLSHVMTRADGTVLAEGTQLLLHVDLATRRACDPPDAVARAIAARTAP